MLPVVMDHTSQKSFVFQCILVRDSSQVFLKNAGWLFAPRDESETKFTIDRVEGICQISSSRRLFHFDIFYFSILCLFILVFYTERFSSVIVNNNDQLLTFNIGLFGWFVREVGPMRLGRIIEESVSIYLPRSIYISLYSLWYRELFQAMYPIISPSPSPSLALFKSAQNILEIEKMREVERKRRQR